MTYIPLYVKTSYSLLASLNDIKKLVAKAKSYNLKALAITDPNLFGVFAFYQECKQNGLKPIIGLEVRYKDTILLLYALNYAGYQNLTSLLYEQQEQELTLVLLKEYRANLICIIPYEGKQYYTELSSLYTYTYLGYSNLEEREVLGPQTNALVFINEVLYLEKEDDEYLKYLYLIRDGKQIQALAEYEIKGCHHLLTKEEGLILSKEVDLKQMATIYNLCQVEFAYNAELLPQYELPSNLNSDQYLKALCKKGLEKRLNNNVNLKYVKRLQYEIDIIQKMGFSNYFLVVWDFVKYAKQNKILVGPGRGSAASSLVAYCLGITDIDPLQYNLLFERFLNPERATMPDIDIDFDSKERETVVNYVISKYGKQRAVPIITFVTLGGKQVIRDVGRIFGVEANLLNKLSGLLDTRLSLVTNLRNNGYLQTLLKQDQELNQIYQVSLKLEGLKRQFSVHAAGLVISKQELKHYLPLQKYNNIYLTGVAMNYLEPLGLLKIDLLGLKNLTLISRVLELINKEQTTPFLLTDIPLTDDKTLTLFKRGLTEGVFQFESRGMKAFLRRLKPDNFEEVIAAVALFRPGPMANIDHYIKRKYKTEKIDYLHPVLKPILESTYGIIVYQEQIMQIAHVLAGYTLGEADILRRAMSKKQRVLLEKEQVKFSKRCQEQGYNEELALKVYRLILKFADYGFNRAHSVPYALIGYRMAYLKIHYPHYFMSSLLTNALGNESKTKLYCTECQALGITLLRPDINCSRENYESTDLGIRFSLAAIKNVGGITCKEIIKEREQGKFSDFFNFVARTYGKAVTTQTINALIAVGCFCVFGYNQKTLEHNLGKALNYAELYKELGAGDLEPPIMEIVPEYQEVELVKREIASLGLSLRAHPVSKYKDQYSNLITSQELENYFNQTIQMLVKIERIKKITTKKGEPMAFISGSDELGIVELVLFPKVYKLYSNLEATTLYLVTGKVEKRMASYQLIVNNLKGVNNYNKN